MRISSATTECTQPLLASKKDLPVIVVLRSYLTESGDTKAGWVAEGLG